MSDEQIDPVTGEVTPGESTDPLDELTKGLHTVVVAVDSQDKRLQVVERAIAREHWGPEIPESFDAWVLEMSEQYYIRNLPERVLSNTAIKREWAALYQAYRHAYGEQGSAWEPTQFHDALARVMSRDDGHEKRRSTFVAIPRTQPHAGTV